MVGTHVPNASVMWPVEHIPDSDRLFMRVHRNDIKDGRPAVGVFRNRGEGVDAGMSTDWSRYATPEETKGRAPAPAKNAVIEMVVGDVRRIPEQVVEHAPDPERGNRAHTNVKGPKKANFAGTQVRYKFLSIWRWAIELEPTDGPPVTESGGPT